MRNNALAETLNKSALETNLSHTIVASKSKLSGKPSAGKNAGAGEKSASKTPQKNKQNPVPPPPLGDNLNA